MYTLYMWQIDNGEIEYIVLFSLAKIVLYKKVYMVTAANLKEIVQKLQFVRVESIINAMASYLFMLLSHTHGENYWGGLVCHRLQC